MLFSRAAKQHELPALGRENGETHCFESEKNALPVFIVSIKSVHQQWSPKKRKTNLAEVKPIISKQMPVHNLGVPALGRIDNNIYTVGLDKAMLPVLPNKMKVPTIFIEAMNSEHSKEMKTAMELELESIRDNDVAVLTPISGVPRNKRVFGSKWALE